ncbi:hypothetical protein ACROYT_G004027 [Oculina patagonica]
MMVSSNMREPLTQRSTNGRGAKQYTRPGEEARRNDDVKEQQGPQPGNAEARLQREANERDAAQTEKQPVYKGEEDGNSGDESVDECDSESDDDDEVVAFVDESDSETEVPVNTPGSTRTRAGRLSIPNSRYLDWLA